MTDERLELICDAFIDGYLASLTREEQADLAASLRAERARVRELEAVLKDAPNLFAYGVGAAASHDPSNGDRCIDESRSLMARIKAALARPRDGAGEGR